MQTWDMGGAVLNAKMLIESYHKAQDTAPPRFLTLRLHPDKYREVYALADIPESIQLGPTLGPLGRQIMRLACIKPPMGVSDGVAIVQDPESDPTKLVFEIHGIAEIVFENLAHVTTPQSA